MAQGHPSPEPPRQPSFSVQAINEVALGCPNVTVLALDVTDPNSIKGAVRKVQDKVGNAGLNLLINTAGTTRRSTLATETAENMTLVYTTNTIGPLQTSQAFLPLLKEAAEAEGQSGMSCSRAAIVNISSILGSIEAAEAWEERQDVCYRCSKAALNMLTKCLALEYGGSGILCVSVDPGYVTPPLGRGTRPHLEYCVHSGILNRRRRWSCWKRSRGGYKDDGRAGAPPIQGQAERVGVVQPGEEKALGRPYSDLPVPEGATGKLERGCSQRLVGTGRVAMGSGDSGGERAGHPAAAGTALGQQQRHLLGLERAEPALQLGVPQQEHLPRSSLSLGKSFGTSASRPELTLPVSIPSLGTSQDIPNRL
ncbi:uncharacterized protein LOC104067255 isoform X3 [Cuculus canorus]|uniref:uncharacterized protein LOC104067255 isoform X3 n=1 Tax=Cuculus canorus TaxID=55661 RepID=UPI0023AB5404|nr:uncharacterized protein LOC104067255 isoform X3 [Cuculus canorus]